jgi:hypothetical protein
VGAAGGSRKKEARVAVRIYTLAKELKLDSKELVDLCTRAGIQDKGSALASLTDEEVAKLREFMAGKAKPAEKPAAPVRSGIAVLLMLSWRSRNKALVRHGDRRSPHPYGQHMAAQASLCTADARYRKP